MRTKIRKLLSLACAISLLLTRVPLHTMADENLATQTDLQTSIPEVQAEPAATDIQEEPETPETPDEPAAEEADREVCIAQDTMDREWTVSGTIGADRQDYVILLTTEKKEELYFTVQANEGTKITVSREGRDTETEFKQKEQENSDPEELPEFILKGYEVEEGSYLIRITGWSGAKFTFQAMTKAAWLENEPEETTGENSEEENNDENNNEDNNTGDNNAEENDDPTELNKEAGEETGNNEETGSNDETENNQGIFGDVEIEAEVLNGEEQDNEPEQTEENTGITDSTDNTETTEPENKPEETPVFEIEDNVLTYYNGEDETVIVPDGIVEIGSRAFYGNETIRTVVLPDSVGIINNAAFAECTNLTTIEISENSSLEIIGSGAFRNDINLDTSFAENVPNILSNAFEVTIEPETEEQTGEEENQEDEESTDLTNEESEENEEPEPTEESEEPEENLLQESPLVLEGSDFTVTVNFGEDAAFPQGTELNVREILPGTEEYRLYSGQTEEVLNENWDEVAEFARFFDITFVYNGEEIEPQAPIDVQMTFAEVIAVTNDAEDELQVQAIHFDEEEGAKVIESEAQSVEAAVEDDTAVDTVAFSSDNFSVYGFVQTAKITQNVITADGTNYRIDITYEQDSEIPVNAELVVTEITPDDERYEGLLQEALKAARRSKAEETGEEIDENEEITIAADQYARFFDIEIKVGDEKQEPAANVSVRISLDDAPEVQPEELAVVHFAGEEEQAVILETTAEDTAEIQFKTNSFSVYGVLVKPTNQYGAEELDGAKFKISDWQNSQTQYMLSETSAYDGSGSLRFKRTTDSAAATIWQFEATGNPGEYYLFTTDGDGTKKYVQFIQHNSSDYADVNLTAEPLTSFNVTNRQNGNYCISTQIGEKEFSLFALGNGSDFGGYATTEDVTLHFTDPVFDSKFFIKGNSNQYLTATINDLATPNAIAKSYDSNDAAIWQFEVAPEGGYYVFTGEGTGKKYINLTYYDYSGAHASLGDSGQAFLVSRNDDNTYELTTISNGQSYFLMEWSGGGGPGFAGYHNDVGDDAHLRLELQPANSQTNKQYMVLAEYTNPTTGAVEYYIVNNDATLTKVIFDEANNKVIVDDPMLWTFNGDHLYFNAESAGYEHNMLTSASYRRYLNPASGNALTEENSGNVTLSEEQGVPSDSGEIVYPYKILDRSDIENQTRFNVLNRYIYNGENYLGIQLEDGVPTQLIGNQPSTNAVKFMFADPTMVKSGPENHMVNHIDIAITGASEVSVPLAYGTYYYRDDDGQWQEYVVDKDVTLDLRNDNVSITAEDMKGATIQTYDKHGNELHDRYIITGYSSNAHSEYSAVQVRVEGQFMVANPDDPSWDPNNVNQSRLNNRITYVVSVIKPLTFDMKDNAHGQLYEKLPDGTYEALSINMDIHMAASFDYYDLNNECPPLQDSIQFPEYQPDQNGDGKNDYREEWLAGGIPFWGNAGMDFVLGGDAEEADANVVAVEITKMIVDENGKLIHPANKIDNKMGIWQNVGANEFHEGQPYIANNVADLNVGQYTTEVPESLYNGYSLLRNKTIAVGTNGVGQIYDYAVKPGMYYITEKNDESNLPQQITDRDGVVWEYKETYIKTEYVRRGDKYDDKTLYPDPMHYSQTYTSRDQQYASVPEVLGMFRTLNGMDKKNGFLEFYVYNVYVCGTKLEVEKKWGNDFVPVDGMEVTFELYYAKRPQNSQEEWPEYDAYEQVDGAAGFDSKVNTTLSLTAGSNWKGAFVNLPETITIDETLYEIDYYAKEITVKVNGVDVTDQYNPTTVKIQPSTTEEAEYSDGKIEVTNTPRKLKVTKKWYMPDGTEYTPGSAADNRVILTADLWKTGTKQTTKNSCLVTIEAKKSDESDYQVLWRGYVKQDSTLRFSVAVNGTSDLRGIHTITPGTPQLEHVGSQSITYSNKTSKNNGNVFRLRGITSDTTIQIDFPYDKVSNTGIGYCILSADTVEGSTYSEYVEDGTFAETITLNSGNGWSYTKENLDPFYAYYIKTDTIRETGTGDRFTLTGPEITTDEEGNKVILLKNTNKQVYTNLDVEKIWAETSTPAEGTQVTVELYYCKRPQGSTTAWPETIGFTGENGYNPVAGDLLFEDADLDATEIILNGGETTPWTASFNHLPTTVMDSNDNVYEVDYAVKETAVRINGGDVTGKYSVVYAKTRSGATDANDKVTVTNTRETIDITVEKVWEPVPSESDASATVVLHRYAKKTKGSITLTLRSDKGGTIQGATFKLYRDNVEQSETYTTDPNGRISITALEPGTYYLKQTGAPEGYTITTEETGTVTIQESIEPQDFSLSATNTVTGTRAVFTLVLTDEVTGMPIQGATFSLTGGASTITGLTTDSNGSITVDIREAGIYAFQETAASDGYILPANTGSESFTVVQYSDNQSSTVTMTNRKIAKGSVTLTLTNPSGDPLPGGYFQLNKDGQLYSENLGPTNSAGQITVSDLPAGSYQFIQTTAPAGYDATAESLTFVVPDNGQTNNAYTVAATDPIHVDSGNVTIQLWRKGSINDPWSWERMAKYDFLAPNKEYTFTAELDVQTVTEGHVYYGTMEGTINPENNSLPSGMQQLTAADLSNGIFTVSFTASEDDKTYNLILATDWSINNIVSFEKVSVAAGQSQQAPTMAMSMSPQMTARRSAGVPFRTGGSDEGSTVSNVSGVSPASAPEGYMEDSTFAETYTFNATNGWSHTFTGADKYDGAGNPYYYYVVETECNPDYYDLESYTGDCVSSASGTIRVTNEARRGNLLISKTFAVTTPAGDPNKVFTFTVTFSGDKAADMVNKSYSAVKTHSDNSTENITVAVGENKQATVTLKAGESVRILNLLYGVAYSITETADPDYEDTAAQSGTITDTSANTFENTRVLGQITVTKTVQLNGTNDTAAANKEFWVAIYTDAQGTNRVTGQDPQKITIGSNGTGTATFSNLPVGTYYVYELTGENGTAVTGNEVTIESAVYTVTTDNSGATVSKSGRTGSASVTNNRTTTDIRIVKVDAVSNEPLTGANFRMERKEGDNYVTFANSAWGLDDDENPTGEFEITDASGSITIEGLPAGTYRITETQPPDGYNNSGIVITFTISADGSVTYDDSQDTLNLVEYTQKATGASETTPDTFTIGNTPGAVLPVTGGAGTWAFTVTGLILTLAAGAFLLKGRRKHRE